MTDLDDIIDRAKLMPTHVVITIEALCLIVRELRALRSEMAASPAPPRRR